MSGGAKRSDKIPEASSFVFGPRRLSFGARLKSDIYGYYGGLAGFEAIRHKISPSVSYSYAPKIVANPLQETVFGAANAFARNVVTVGFNQTFEAKRIAGEDDLIDDLEDFRLDLDEDLLAPDSILDARADSLLSLQEAPIEILSDEQLDPDGPTRLPPSRVVNVLALNTSVVTYDFVRARKEDEPLRGFTTTRLRNQISSDFLRGLRLSVEHDIFDDVVDPSGEERRVFDMALSQLNFSFAVSSNSGVIQALGGLFGGGGDAQSDAADPAAADSAAALADRDDIDPLLDNVGNLSHTDESSIVPGGGANDVVGQAPQRAVRPGSGGAWNANFSY